MKRCSCHLAVRQPLRDMENLSGRVGECCPHVHVRVRSLPGAVDQCVQEVSRATHDAAAGVPPAFFFEGCSTPFCGRASSSQPFSSCWGLTTLLWPSFYCSSPFRGSTIPSTPSKGSSGEVSEAACVQLVRVKLNV